MIPRSSDGYTLVELVVVMLLLGLIALACESGLHFGSQVWSRAASGFDQEEQMMASQSILRGLLAHSLPRLKGDAVTFEGTPTDIRFDVVPPEAFQEGGTAHAVLHIRPADHDSVLTLDMQSIANPEFAKHATLLTGRGLLRMSYLDRSGHAQTWLSFWRDRSRLPDAVRIESDNPKAFPTLIVGLPITESISCIPDPVSMACRKI